MDNSETQDVLIVFQLFAKAVKMSRQYIWFEKDKVRPELFEHLKKIVAANEFDLTWFASEFSRYRCIYNHEAGGTL